MIIPTRQIHNRQSIKDLIDSLSQNLHIPGVAEMLGNVLQRQSSQIIPPSRPFGEMQSRQQFPIPALNYQDQIRHSRLSPETTLPQLPSRGLYGDGPEPFIPLRGAEQGDLTEGDYRRKQLRNRAVRGGVLGAVLNSMRR